MEIFNYLGKELLKKENDVEFLETEKFRDNFKDVNDSIKIPEIQEYPVESEIDFKELEEKFIDSIEIEKISDDESVLMIDINIIFAKECHLPRTGGTWEGEEGNSRWVPDDNVVPGDRNGTNPEHKTWKEIKQEYNFDSIPFKDGYPDFSEVSKGEVEIDDFTENRADNFTQADEKLAKQRGCTPEEVSKWRSEHKYTWHECEDGKTMQKVPTEVHGNVPHSGGISLEKDKN